MLTRKRIVVASLIITMVLGSIMFISPVKAVTYEMPPYDDKWTLTGGSNYPWADANLSTGRLTVFMFPFTECVGCVSPPSPKRRAEREQNRKRRKSDVGK